MKAKLALAGLVFLMGWVSVGCGQDGTPGPVGAQGVAGTNGIIPAPSLTASTPASGVGAGGGTLTLTGTNFVPGFTNVSVGGVPATNVVVSGTTSLTATVPPGSQGAGRDIVVTTPGGSATLAGAFTYRPAVLFVSNVLTDAITAFPTTQTTNTAPFRSLTSGIDQPLKMTAAGGEIYFGQVSPPSVKVFRSSAASGDAAVRTITFPFTQPYSVAVSNGYLFVGDNVLNSIFVFNQNANGNATPVRTITGLNLPNDLFVNGNELWVTSVGDVSVKVLDAGSGGVAAPIRQIGGTGMNTNTGLQAPEAVAVFNGEVYVFDRNTNRISVFPATANGDVAPTRSWGVTTAGNNGDFVIFNNEIYLTLGGADRVEVYNVNQATAAQGTVVRGFAIPDAPTFPIGLAVDNTVSAP